ncbi:glycosyltransferase family 2 protein [Humibacter sp. BT305]|nr:glycosyltransferase family 2 protein [Humibacter sp. BT305]
MASVHVVIPTRGERRELDALVEMLLSRTSVKFIWVVQNGSRTVDHLASWSTSSRDRVALISSGAGYSSPRNAGATRAIEQGASGVVFVDDDVVLTSAGIDSLFRNAELYPDSLIGLTIERRVRDTSRLAHALHPQQAAMNEPADDEALSAACMYVPGEELKHHLFSAALNWTGAEDTALSYAAFTRGRRVWRLPSAGSYEVLEGEHGSADAMFGRIVATHAVRTVLRRAPQPEQWESKPVDGWPSYAFASIVRIGGRDSRFTRLQMTVATGIGKFLGRLGTIPVKQGGRWSRLARIS